jgi:hypothetical protein
VQSRKGRADFVLNIVLSCCYWVEGKREIVFGYDTNYEGNVYSNEAQFERNCLRFITDICCFYNQSITDLSNGSLKFS